MNANPNWYIVYTKPGYERKVAKLLTGKHVENYCPTHTVLHKSHYQERLVRKQLFSSYIFVLCTEEELDGVKKLNGVISILYWRNKPAIVQQEEIETIKHTIRNFRNVELRKTSMSLKITEMLEKDDQHLFPLASLGYVLVAENKRTEITFRKPSLIQYADGTAEPAISASPSLGRFFRQLPGWFAIKTKVSPTTWSKTLEQ
jgi:transcription antitermination factor NusG